MDAFIGEIRAFAGDYVPVGWLDCDGRLLQISSFATLFSLFGVTYGGDGVSNFALPDLRGRLPMGVGGAGDRTIRTLGEQDGTETVTLTLQQMPPHEHAVTTATVRTTNRPQGGVPAPGGAYGTVASGLADGAAVVPQGAGLAHENRAPALAVRFIVCVEGTFPQRP